MKSFRVETDSLGQQKIPENIYWGIHTKRAIDNFNISQYRQDKKLISAYAYVKQAACLVNAELGFISFEKAKALSDACDEIIAGKHSESFPLDPFSGGAGTSFNMNLNEVIANRALEILGQSKGDYTVISPLETVNLHQSTNDTFPTAVKVAALFYLDDLESSLTDLQQAFQGKEQDFSDIIKLGRTETQAAVPMTLGLEFSGFSELFTQDRWRVFKARERLRLINFGGTAIGTGLTAPRDYIFRVTDKLRSLTGLNLCRAENLIYPTQNADSFVEASGILKTVAVNLIKVSRDLRSLSALGEISLAALQAGSSIMPGKINPVALEAVIQAGLRCLSNDSLLNNAAALGSLQINEFLPLIAFSLLESLGLLNNAVVILNKTVITLTANEERCRFYLNNSPAIITAFLPLLGYNRTLELLKEYQSGPQTVSIPDFLNDRIGQEQVNRVLSPENLRRLGFTETHEGR
ncbi:MAG: aspartate ammonia-lyase [Candidatus Omnitrophica bacterium]|nr:aspartate ammonia-lyase [Candidatus Omnitrophota bacterium]